MAKKWLHILFEHEYCLAIQNLLNSHTDANEHQFIILGRSSIHPQFQFHYASNSQKIEQLHETLFTDFEHVFIHGLFMPQTVDFFSTHPDISQKSTWVVWGGDIYAYLVDSSHVEYPRIHARKSILNQLHSVCTALDGDYELICEIAERPVPRFDAFYPVMIDLREIKHIRTIPSQPYNLARILVGNSATSTNCHREVFDTLSQLSNQTFEVHCPLNYGPLDYQKEICELGQAYFGSRFVPLLESLDGQTYLHYLNSMDLGIMAHNRQQGNGNIFSLLALGKKVFIRSSVSTWKYIQDLGIYVSDYLELDSQSLEQILEFPKENQTNNLQRCNQVLHADFCAARWKRLFQTLQIKNNTDTQMSATYQNFSQKIKQEYFPNSQFVGPYEQHGFAGSIFEEQWLWNHRELIRGRVLDMSTPQYWHQFIYDFPQVSEVLISEFGSDTIEKCGQKSKAHIVGDFAQSDLPCTPNSFDTIISLSILEHCTDPQQMVKNFHSLLRPGGIAFIWTPFAYVDGHLEPDYWRFTKSGLLRLTDLAGLRLIDQGSFLDIGFATLDLVGVDLSANGHHNGIPAARWIIVQKPFLAQNDTLHPLLQKWTQNHQQTEFLDQYLAQLTDLNQKNKVQHWIQLIKGNQQLPPMTWSMLSQFPVKYLYAGDLAEIPTHQGFVGLSINQSNHEHLYHDMTQALPLEDSTVDFFQSEDVFEHIPLNLIPGVLNEIYRVLKPGSKLRLSVPDYRCDILYQRSQKNHLGEIVFDPGGGGTPENPGHLWFPKYESLKNLINQTQFATAGRVDFLHYYDEFGFAVMNPIDHRLGRVKRTPDFDARVQNPPRPMSLVVDLYKEESQAPQSPSPIKSTQESQNTYYDQAYFEWQQSVGAFGGMANLFKFEPWVNSSHHVIDFGCGGGYLLRNLPTPNKVGIEVNPVARQFALDQGSTVVSSLSEINDLSVDRVISNHALEHVDHPVEILKEVLRVLKVEGLAVFVVPHDCISQEYNPQDVNKHLYTWNPMTLGNLFERAGFKIIESKKLSHAWPPEYLQIQKQYGWETFHQICQEHALKSQIHQVRVIAQKIKH